MKIVRYLSNNPKDPTIKISEDDQEWQDAYNRWLSHNDPPTEDPRWKQGIFLTVKKED